MRVIHNVPQNALYSTLVFLIPLIVFMIYWDGLAGPFLIDDHPNLLPIAKTLETPSWENLNNTIFSRSGIDRIGRSLSFLSFSVTILSHGLSSFYFKYENLLLHIINGLLILWITGRLFSHILDQEQRRFAWPIGLGVSLIWLIHPLQVSTVLYAVQRLAILSALFSLSSVLFYILARQNQLKDNRNDLRCIPLFAASFISFVFAIFSKEDGALLPLYLLITEWLFFQFKSNSRQNKLILWSFLTPSIFVPLFGGSLYFILHLDNIMYGYVMRNFTLFERLMSESHIMWFYIKIIFLPALSRMGMFHDDFVPIRHLDSSTIAAISMLFLLVATALWQRKKRPIISFGILWFIAAHLLESTIFPLELIFEHRNYIALFGPAFTVGYYVTIGISTVHSPNLRYFFSALTALLLVLLGSLTYLRADTWSDRTIFLRVAEIEHPNSPRLLSELANLELSNNQFVSARHYLDRAIEIDSTQAGPVLHKMLTYCHEDNFPPELVDKATHLLREGKLTAFSLSAINGLNSLWQSQRCPAMSLDTYLRLTEPAASNTNTFNKYRFFSLTNYARALFLANRYEEATKVLEKAMTYSKFVGPSYRPQPLFLLVESHIALGNLPAAIKAIDRIKKLDKSPFINSEKNLNELANKYDIPESIIHRTPLDD